MHIFNGVDLIIIVVTAIVVWFSIKDYYEEKYNDTMWDAYREGKEDGMNKIFALWKDVNQQVENLEKEEN